ncbi:MAG: amidohydrolase family protein [Myxococcales bacterium]|nr:amidohydrolase family protein [Myxococcales bacterium]
MSFTLIGGRVLDPVSGMDQVTNVSVDADGRISGIGAQRAGKLVDVSGQWVLPGLVDVGTYAGEAGGDGSDGLAATAQAALTGGFATLMLSPSMSAGAPRIDHPSMVQALRSRASEVPIAIKIIAAATRTRGDGQVEIADIAGMVRAGAVAIGNVGHREQPIANAAIMRRALEHAKTIGVTAIASPLDVSLREGGVATEGAIATRMGYRPDPAASEHAALARDLEIAALAQTPLLCFGITTARAVELVRAAKARGLRITAAAPMHHLLLDETALLTAPYDTNFRLDPPLRRRDDVDALIAGVASGEIDCVATAHTPLGQLAKEPEFEDAEPGALGLQTCLAALLGLVAAGRLPLLRAIDAVTAAPARSLGLSCGTLKIGQAADLCLFDPAERWVVDGQAVGSWASNTPLWGKQLTGRVTATIVGGIAHYDRHSMLSAR